MTPENASDIAIRGLQFIADDMQELTRFVSLTGISPDEFRTLAATTEFMTAILDYFLGNEPTLLAFTAQAGLDPASIKAARIALSPPTDSGIL